MLEIRLPGSWQATLPLTDRDGLPATVIISGTDGVGNHSAPVIREVIIDTVPPVLSR